MTAVTLVGVAGALLVLAVVIRLVLRGLLNVRYAALWLVVAFVVAILALFPSVLDRLAHTLGFAVGHPRILPRVRFRAESPPFIWEKRLVSGRLDGPQASS